MKTITEKTNSWIEKQIGHFYLEHSSVTNSQGERVRMYPKFMANGMMTVEVVDQVPFESKKFEIPATVNCITTICRIEISENEFKNALSTRYMGGNRYYNWIADENGTEYVKEYTVSFDENDFTSAIQAAKEYREKAEKEHRISIQMHDDPHFGE